MNKTIREFLKKYQIFEELCGEYCYLQSGTKREGNIGVVAKFTDTCTPEIAYEMKSIRVMKNFLSCRIHCNALAPITDETLSYLNEMSVVALERTLKLMKKKMNSPKFKKKYPEINPTTQFSAEAENIKNRLNRAVKLAELDAPDKIFDNEIKMLKEAIEKPLSGEFIKN